MVQLDGRNYQQLYIMPKLSLILTLVPIANSWAYPDSYEHLGLCSLAAMARNEKFECTVIDGFFLKLAYSDYINELLDLTQKEAHCIVGFSIRAEEFLNDTINTIKFLHQKRPNITIIAGGMYPTWKAEELLNLCPEIDYILRGEADNSLIDFLNKFSQDAEMDTVDGIAYIKNHTFFKGRFPFPSPDITKLPLPVRDFAPVAVSRNNLLSVSTSRGCDYNCSFCGIHGFNGKRRSRTVEQIVEEIDQLKKNFNPEFINIVDPTFIGSGEKGLLFFKRLGAELRDLKANVKFSFEIRPDQVDRESLSIWKQVGIEVIHIGVESGYQPTLKRFNKQQNTSHVVNQAIETLEELKIPYTIGFIMFHPWTTLDEIRANIEFSLTTLRGKNNFGLFNTLRMYAGSDLSKRWTGAFSPYPNVENYFVDPKVQLFFSKLVSKEIYEKIRYSIDQQETNLLYHLFLDLLNDIA